MARSYISFPQLVDIVGEAGAVNLCRAHGGQALYVVKKPERSHLAGTISGAAIESLCAAFGGEELMLASGPARRVPIKARVIAMLEAGCSHTEAARECACTVRYVQYLAADIEGAKQPAPPSKKSQILALFKRRTPDAEIVLQVGCSAAYVANLRSQARRGVA